MITPDRRILPAAQTQLIDPTGRATPTFYDFLRRIVGVTGLTPELIQQLEEIIAKIEELEAGGFLPATANVIGQDSILSQGTLAGGVVTLQLQGDTSDQRSTWYYGSNEVSEKGWFRFYNALATGAGILKRNSGYIELGELADPADLPPAGNIGEAYWVDGASDITERGLWAWDGAAWVLDPVATGIVSFEVANADYGDITVTGDGAAWTIDPNAVTDAKLRDSAALSVIGRSADTPGDPADIIAAASGSVLTRQSNQVLFTTTPIWEGTHRWIDNAEVQLGTGGDLRLFHDGTSSTIRNDTGQLNIHSDAAMALTAATNFSLAVGGTAAINATSTLSLLSSSTISLQGTTVDVDNGPLRLIDDNQELQIGAGQDLRLVHDGTNSIIRNDTGVLNINEGATTVGRFDTDTTAGNTRFMVYDVDNGTLERVSVGAANSGGTGFKLLRIPN